MNMLMDYWFHDFSRRGIAQDSTPTELLRNTLRHCTFYRTL